MLPANNEDDMSYEECTDDLNRICADIANASEDTVIALAQIADNQIPWLRQRKTTQKRWLQDLSA